MYQHLSDLMPGNRGRSNVKRWCYNIVQRHKDNTSNPYELEIIGPSHIDKLMETNLSGKWKRNKYTINNPINNPINDSTNDSNAIDSNANIQQQPRRRKQKDRTSPTSLISKSQERMFEELKAKDKEFEATTATQIAQISDLTLEKE